MHRAIEFMLLLIFCRSISLKGPSGSIDKKKNVDINRSLQPKHRVTRWFTNFGNNEQTRPQNTVVHDDNVEDEFNNLLDKTNQSHGEYEKNIDDQFDSIFNALESPTSEQLSLSKYNNNKKGYVDGESEQIIEEQSLPHNAQLVSRQLPDGGMNTEHYHSCDSDQFIDEPSLPNNGQCSYRQLTDGSINTEQHHNSELPKIQKKERNNQLSSKKSEKQLDPKNARIGYNDRDKYQNNTSSIVKPLVKKYEKGIACNSQLHVETFQFVKYSSLTEATTDAQNGLISTPARSKIPKYKNNAIRQKYKGNPNVKTEHIQDTQLCAPIPYIEQDAILDINETEQSTVSSITSADTTDHIDKQIQDNVENQGPENLTMSLFDEMKQVESVNKLARRPADRNANERLSDTNYIANISTKITPIVPNDVDMLHLLKKTLIYRHITKMDQKITIKKTDYIKAVIKTLDECRKRAGINFLYQVNSNSLIISPAMNNNKRNFIEANEATLNTTHVKATLESIFLKLIQNKECLKTLHDDNFTIIYYFFEKAFAEKRLNNINLKTDKAVDSTDSNVHNFDFSFLLYLEYLCIFMNEKSKNYKTDVSNLKKHVDLLQFAINALVSCKVNEDKEKTEQQKKEKNKTKDIALFFEECSKLNVTMYNEYIIAYNIETANNSTNEALKEYLIGAITLDTIALLVNLAYNYNHFAQGKNITFFKNDFDIFTELLKEGKNSKCVLPTNIVPTRFIYNKKSTVIPSAILLTVLNKYMDLLFLPINFIPTNN